MKVAHVITGLGAGGAETFLLSLAEGLPPQIRSEVISLSGAGPIGERLEARGVPVHALGLSGAPRPKDIFRLRSLLRDIRPDVVQTWMHHADLIGGGVAWSLRMPVAWNIRGEAFTPATRFTFKKSSILTIQACALLSRFVPKSIVCCAQSCVATHRSVGYGTGRMVVIPNGVDTARFSPRPDLGVLFRKDHGLESRYVVSMVGRVHPQKNQAGFIAAATKIAAERLDVDFLIAGPGVTEPDGPVARLIELSPFKNRFHLMDAQPDLVPLYSATDVLVCPSLTEAFPNVIAEAMACEVVCVSNDAGDAAHIIGDAGIVASGADPHRLAQGVLEIIALGDEQRRALAARARRRMAEHFSFKAAVQRYVSLYEQLAAAA